MTEEFDEDVVFENSPLFQYLQDLGHTDFETCPVASQEEEIEEDGDCVRRSTGGRLWTVTEKLWRWIPVHRDTSRKLEQQMDCVLGGFSVRSILDQDVLLQEDVELIELLDPSLLTIGSAPYPASTPPRPGLLATPSSWDMAVLAALASVLLGLSSASGGPCGLITVPWVLALIGWVGLRGAALWRRGLMQRAVYRRANQLQTLVHNGKMLTGMSRKALRLVQETEVISRGFTLVSAANSFSRAAPGAGSRGQQLIGLRKALYRALRSAFRASRRATCHMLKAFPLSSEVDNVTNYVSAVPLKDLGLGLGVEHLGDEQAQELTDDYSLPALKMLFQLWVGQSSECFRRLALLLSPRRIEEQDVTQSTETSPPPLHRSLGAVTEPLHLALSGCLGEVQRSYDFHRHFEAKPRAESSAGARRAREKCRELNSLHTSIRSLQLHLKALLSEMIIMEDDLEKLMVSNEVPEPTLEGYGDINDRLQQLQPHMQASAGCWEDVVTLVERMMRRAKAGPGSPEDQDLSASLPLQAPAPPPSFPLILDADPIPEELEWEAYVSESDSDGEGGGSWVDLLSPEERERQRREREESRRVLSELKAVLGFRASEDERMKRKQLLFNDRAAVTPMLHCKVSNANDNAPSDNDDRNQSDDHTSDLPTDAVTEFSCGLEGGEMGGAPVCSRGGGGASESHQYDGVAEDEETPDSTNAPLKPRIPAVALMDRLTEIHGAETLSLSSALAAQVAARSQALVSMEEQTYGDDEDDDATTPDED
ncbi:vezatin isoform X2 [Gouania willdenowi]|uniref:Vezatin n=1 Tax=Gouania willdenowi TaxID=441366 RepID=A0A8C5D3G6_GOUWI|nr:vezatin isoform X2 [Gouania willdenowi]